MADQKNPYTLNCFQKKSAVCLCLLVQFMLHLGFILFQGPYEPGKRHWLKVKKDYLNEGAMADTADLVVLGAFYGKGSNGLHQQYSLYSSE